jgi:hypothetical protein
LNMVLDLVPHTQVTYGLLPLSTKINWSPGWYFFQDLIFHTPIQTKLLGSERS